VRHLVLSQSTRVTDRRTDGRTDRITTPKTALTYARAVKTFRKYVHGKDIALQTPSLGHPPSDQHHPAAPGAHWESQYDQ